MSVPKVYKMSVSVGRRNVTRPVIGRLWQGRIRPIDLFSSARPTFSRLFPSQGVVSSRLHRQDSNLSHLISKLYKGRRYVKKETTLLV